MDAESWRVEIDKIRAAARSQASQRIEMDRQHRPRTPSYRGDGKHDPMDTICLIYTAGADPADDGA